MRPYAPDKDRPFPRPKPKPTGNNGGGNQGTVIDFSPGQVQAYVDEQMAGLGGDPKKWREHFNDVYSPIHMPNYSWEKNGGGKKGGGKDTSPTGTPTGNPTGNNNGGGTDPHYPFGSHGRSARPMVGQPAMTSGFLAPPPQMAMAAQNMPANRGFLSAPAMGQTIQGPARLPPEIQALMRR